MGLVLILDTFSVNELAKRLSARMPSDESGTDEPHKKQYFSAPIPGSPGGRIQAVRHRTLL